MQWDYRSTRWTRWVERQIERWIPPDPRLRHALRVRIIRTIAIANILFGLYYFIFRYTDSLNMNALWFAVPLLLAETYSFIDTLLFIFMMWRPAYRESPPTPEGVTVDVFITTYSEPVELVRDTAEAALRIHYPHKTYVLDDGNRPQMRRICEELGCGYIVRGTEWENRPRHAKAGNVNNALMQTNGEFILILDADQIPSPEILHETLGYFDDPKVALVQTPQYFYNIPPDDPFGTQAPLFYGPIQQGKDGWDAAFFCGSNAILRRESLFQLGLVRYVEDIETRVRQRLNQLPIDLYGKSIHEKYQQAAHQVSRAAEDAVRALRREAPMMDVLYHFNAQIKDAQRSVIARDLSAVTEDLIAIIQMEDERDTELAAYARDALRTIHDNRLVLAQDLTSVIAPSPDALGLDEDTLRLLNFDFNEAMDVQPLVTFSITEDMATCMQLHAIGWKSVFHPKILAKGLAPDDLGSVLGQRLRWGAGTIQVLLQDNPLTKRGLSFPQRMQYFTTMFSYFSGFSSLMYLIAPIIYLFFNVPPVTSFSGDFLIRIIPYLLMNKLLFYVVAWKLKVFRGEQYSLALFPLWIRAVLTVFSGQKLQFNVTPKTRQSGVFLTLIIPQLVLIILLSLGCVYGLLGLALGWRDDVVGVGVNIFWALYDIFMLSVIVKAAVYKPAESEQPT